MSFACKKQTKNFEQDIKVEINKKNYNKTKKTNTHTNYLSQKLHSIPKKFLPQLFNNNTSLWTNCGINSYCVEIVQKNRRVYIKVEKIDDFNIESYGIFIYTKNINQFLSYFYFISKNDSTWQIVNEKLLSNSFFSFFKNKINNSMIDSINCLKLGTKNKAYIFDFAQKMLMEIDTNFYSKKVATISIFENKIYLVDTNQESIANKEIIDIYDEKTYIDIFDALNNSDKVKICNFSAQNLYFLPKNFDKLKNIEILIFDNNLFLEIPMSVNKIKKLRVISFANNKLEKLPDVFGSYATLEDINFSGNSIKHIPVWIIRAQTLQKVNFSSNKISNFDFNLSKLTNLYYLNISNNKIKKIPYSIGKLQNLVSIDISNNPIEYLPQSFFQLKNLKYINLKNTKLNKQTIQKVIETFPEASVYTN